MDPSDSNHIVANDLSGATPTMVRTTDGGANWTTLPALDQLLSGNGAFVMQVQRGATDNGYAQASLVAINPRDRNMIVVDGQDSGVFLTTNGGANWNLLTDSRTNVALRPHISRPLYAHFEPVDNNLWNLYVGARGRGVWRIGLDNFATGTGVLLSTGNDFEALQDWTGAGHGGAPKGWYVGDFDGDGDGKNDIFRYMPSQSRAEVLLSSGTTFKVLKSWTSAGYGAAPSGWYVGDFNGDQKEDIFRYIPSRL